MSRSTGILGYSMALIISLGLGVSCNKPDTAKAGNPTAVEAQELSNKIWEKGNSSSSEAWQNLNDDLAQIKEETLADLHKIEISDQDKAAALNKVGQFKEIIAQNKPEFPPPTPNIQYEDIDTYTTLIYVNGQVISQTHTYVDQYIYTSLKEQKQNGQFKF